ncbi:MAG: hypothetical protein WC285_02160 [Candidatus Gracilibacteria bacterium]
MAISTAGDKSKNRTHIIRYIYLYLVTAITIIMILISAIGFLNIVLREYVLKVKDYNQINGPYECTDDQLFFTYDSTGKQIARTAVPLTEAEKTAKKAECVKKSEETTAFNHVNDIKRELANYIAMILVALPMFLYHWGIIKKENSKK